jgi:hypothetical protein
MADRIAEPTEQTPLLRQERALSTVSTISLASGGSLSGIGDARPEPTHSKRADDEEAELCSTPTTATDNASAISRIISVLLIGKFIL